MTGRGHTPRRGRAGPGRRACRSSLWPPGRPPGPTSRISVIAGTRTEPGGPYDIAILSDFRYPGGTSASIAEEIEAQHAAGLTTVLVHVPAPHLRTVTAFHPRIMAAVRDGKADLAPPGGEVSAHLLVVRHPRVLEVDPDPVPVVRASHVVMVVNQPPRDRGGRTAYYDPLDVRERLERLFGPSEWAPIGPLVRQALHEEAPELPMSERDWVNVIDVSEWETDRSHGPRDPIVLGRFSRPDLRKWPESPEQILAAYPDADDVRVRVLGGGEMACELLGRQPRNWDVLPFGAMDPRDFVRTFDVFVYFHASSLVEAFGRTVLEAMASGAPVILPRTFEPLFGDGALYGTPEDVGPMVRRLRDVPDEYHAWSSQAREFVQRRFSHEAHVERVLERLPETVRSTRPTPPPRTSPAALRTGSRPERVLMLSSNGAGLGHVTRLMAIGRRLPAHLQAVVATQSQAAPLVHGEGYPVEYVPSRGHLGVPAGPWNEMLRERMDHLLECYEPALVLVDGTVPYSGLVQAMQDHREVPWVWLRRGMWKPGLGHEWVRRGRAYDAVIEPGDYAEDDDIGVTVSERDSARRVGPITYLDVDELTNRTEARQALGLPTEGVMALLQLGAGNINDIQSPVGRLARQLDAAGVEVVVARSPIATRRLDVPDGVRVISTYPLSRHLRAFDFTFSAGGYNSFHECIGFAVPTVFVANEDTALDDQERRVAGATQRGLALSTDSDLGDSRAIEQILDPSVREGLRSRCERARRANGARDAAAHIAELVGSSRGADR